MGKSIFIIILNWNGWHDTLECVASCKKLSYPDFRIIIVDNGSTDGSEEKLRNSLKDTEVIQTSKNLGFAGGNNIGIKYALEHAADYIWLLNNDTVVEPETLGELVKVAEADTRVGIVGSKILLKDRPDTLHFAGGTVDLQTGITTHLGAFEKDHGQYDHLTEVDYVTGSSLLIKRQVIEKIGLMPEEYFLYYEETDWCLQAKKKGYALHMAPKSRVFHKVSATVSKVSATKSYYLTRNRLYFLKKHGENVNWSKRFLTDLRQWCFLLRTFRFNEANKILLSYYHWTRNYNGPIV